MKYTDPNIVPHVRWCEEHGKKGFTKKNAKKLIRKLKGKHSTGMREYPCGLLYGLWHTGHLPQAVLMGEKTTLEVYGPPTLAA